MTKYPDLFADLAAPFDAPEVKIRTQGGRQLAYITARTAMNRLDTVVGPENWWDEYTHHENLVLCKLTLRLPDGSTVTKIDAGGHAGMNDSGDDEKSAVSDAFKRTCIKFGVGRYLYGDGAPRYRREREAVSLAPEEPVAEAAPALAPARPPVHAPASNGNGNGNGHPAPAPAVNGNANGNANGNGNAVPTSGRGLYAWAKDMDARHDVQLFNFLTRWGKNQEFPARMVDWDNEQVNLGYAEAMSHWRGASAPPAPATPEPAERRAPRRREPVGMNN